MVIQGIYIHHQNFRKYFKREITLLSTNKTTNFRSKVDGSPIFPEVMPVFMRRFGSSKTMFLFNL